VLLDGKHVKDRYKQTHKRERHLYVCERENTRERDREHIRERERTHEREREREHIRERENT
jgi:hypothetical protein